MPCTVLTHWLVSMSSSLELKTLSNVRTASFTMGIAALTSPTDINSELDELDREEFYRLKKVSGKKQRDVAAADAEIAAARQKEAEKKAQAGTPAQEAKEEEAESTDVLGEQEDNDVIF